MSAQQPPTAPPSLQTRRRAHVRGEGPPLAFLNTRWGRDEAAGLHLLSHGPGGGGRLRAPSPRTPRRPPSRRAQHTPTTPASTDSPSTMTAENQTPTRAKRRIRYAPPSPVEIKRYACRPLPSLPVSVAATAPTPPGNDSKPSLSVVQDALRRRRSDPRAEGKWWGRVSSVVEKGFGGAVECR